MEYTHIIVGGGAYGCYLALKLLEIMPSAKVLLIEREKDLLLRASYNNQARIHNGYHYPRSLLTALRSRINFPRFIQEFPECVVSNFEHVYAIAAQRSKVTAQQFYEFCQRIGAELKPAPAYLKKLFDGNLIEEIFVVKEYAFNARKLREILVTRLANTNVQVLTSTEVVKVIGPEKLLQEDNIRVLARDIESGEIKIFYCQYVYNCTYSELNNLIVSSRLEKLHLKHEATEMALIRVPDCLAELAITVMCGPFFSIVPFPDKGLFTFSHVSYTPHYEWAETPLLDQIDAVERPKFPLTSNFDRMARDAARYLPAISSCAYVESLWEVKTILPQSDSSDSRPILFKPDVIIPQFISILGGKIDNIFEIDEALLEHH
jgi:glycine/D-amino acid oxidase-like deaminating enzyme